MVGGMSLTNPIPRGTREVTVTTAPGQTVFGPIDFLLFDPADLALWAKIPGADYFQALDPDTFTVTPSAPATAWPAFPTVALDASLVAGSTLRLRGVRVPARATDVTRDGKLQSQSLERELDKQVATEQELRRDIDRSSANADQVESIAAAAAGMLDEINGIADQINDAIEQISVIADRPTAAAVEAAPVPALTTHIRTAGFSVVGDYGDALYKRVGAEPGHAAKLRSSDGAWWEMVPQWGRITTRQLGLHLAPYVNDCALALTEFLDASVALGAQATGHPGDTYTCPSGTVDIPENANIEFSFTTIVRDTDLTIPLFQCVGGSLSRKNNIRFRGGLLKYTAATTVNTITNSTALWLKFCGDSRVEDVKIEGPFYIGFRFDDCTDTTLDGFAVRGVYNRALYIGATTYTENIHCLNGLCDGYAPGTTTRVTNHIINTNAYGTGSGRNVTFTNITSRNGTLDPAGEAFAFSERIFAQKAVNCRAVNCPTGFNVQAANGYGNQNVQLVNCEADGCDRSFIGTGCFYLILTGCRSTGHKIAGFQFTDCVVVILTGCLANGTGLATGTCDGFLFLGSTSGVTITGCAALNNGHSSTPSSGTAFKCANTCSNIVGRGNYAALNGTKLNLPGLSGIDFPSAASSGNLFP